MYNLTNQVIGSVIMNIVVSILLHLDFSQINDFFLAINFEIP